VQWMLRRRGAPSALVFGIMPDRGTGDIHALHAWVEAGGMVIIGDDPTRSYARGLTLVQP
jgi:Transglutaminase-like superfamily